MPDLGWLAAPVAALLFGCLALVPLGRQVLTRGVIFIDLAVAQVAACGALAAHLLSEHGHGLLHAHAHDHHDHDHGHGHGHGHGDHAHHHDHDPLGGHPSDESWLPAGGMFDWLGEPASILPLLLPTIFASLGALIVWFLARRVPSQREALIGLVYVAAASTALLMASTDPHGREQLDTLLAADVLWAPWPPVLCLGAVSALVLLISLRHGRRRGDTGPSGWHDALFYPVFALAMSLAVPVLGLYLVFALLIGPSLWHRHGLSVPGSCLMATGACAAGLALSWQMDWPSGTCVAICLSVLGLGSAIRRNTAAG